MRFFLIASCSKGGLDSVNGICCNFCYDRNYRQTVTLSVGGISATRGSRIASERDQDAGEQWGAAWPQRRKPAQRCRDAHPRPVLRPFWRARADARDRQRTTFL